jgi:hypothetical protein
VTEPQSQPARPAWQPVLEVLIRVGGAVVAVAGGALLGVFATLMTPFRIGGTLVPISLLLAVGGNAALIWFSYFTTRNKFLALLPGLVWAGFAFLGVDRTNEGDIVLYQQNWVSTVYLFVGAITVSIAAYRLIVPKPAPLTPR